MYHRRACEGALETQGMEVAYTADEPSRAQVNALPGTTDWLKQNQPVTL